MKAFLLFLLTCCACCGQVVLQNAVLGNASFGSPVTGGGEEGNSLTNGIVAYWGFEAAGNITNDSGPNEYDLTLTEPVSGQITNITGKVGEGVGAAWYDTRYLGRDDADYFSPLANSLTVAAWVSTSDTNQAQTIVSKLNYSTGANEWLLWWNQTTFGLVYYTNGATATRVPCVTNDVVEGQWYFVVGEIDATNLVHKVRYGDSSGNLYGWETSATWGGYGPDGTGTNTAANLRLGMVPGNWYLQYYLDEVGIWNRALTDAEVTNIYNSGTGFTWPLE